MSEQTRPKRICPYLGFANDPHSRFGYPDPAHRCFAAGQGATVPAEHQSAFCMSQRYSSCPRFIDLPVDAETGSPIVNVDASVPRERTSLWQIALLGVGGLVIGLLIILGLFFVTRQPDNEVLVSTNSTPIETNPSPRANTTIVPVLTEEVENTPTPVAVAIAETPTSTPTPDDLEVIELSPDAGDIGWATNGEEQGNHFGDSYLYAGIFNGQVYNGAFLFDLSTIPRGASIEYAAIEMTGLREDRLAVRSDASDAAGVWTLRMLTDEFDQGWRRFSFQQIFNIAAVQTLSPILSSEDLAAEQVNVFELSQTQIDIIRNRVIDKENPTASFRIEGPLVGPNNLFAWDTGYGEESQREKVKLVLRVGEPPATPPIYDFLLVTSTPTPENVLTAAAVAVQLTADASQFGTVTPLPPNAVTPTPFPEYLVLVPTPTPENEATADALNELATAIAVTTGTATPIATDAVTATPTPTETATPIPTSPSYVLITSTPTPDTIFAAATQAVRATVLAQQNGTATPLPEDWVTPVVVTATPTPMNQETAQAIFDIAVAAALTTGTPTPTPANLVTATSTPVFEAMPLIITPIPATPTPAIPNLMPAQLLGKILFKSDREGEGGEDFVYVFDPETGGLGRLTASWPYDMALTREEWSANKQYRVFTKDAIRNPLNDGNPELVPAIFVYDNLYKDEWQVTRHGTGIAYNGVFSPVSREIAFVSNDSADDEIWVVNYDGSNSLQLTSSNEVFNAREIGKDTFIPELNKYPSWSPDGQQIVFASTRTGNMQLWIMNADGSDQRLLMGWDNWTPYNDWSPVWVKYLDPAPPEYQLR